LARRYLASNLMKRGDGLKDRDEAGALGAYEEARTIASDLAKKHADNIEWQLDVPTLWGRIGTLKWRAGDRQAAISSFDKALESSQRVAATAQKDQINYCRCHTATLLNIIGELKEESNEWTGALKAYEQAYEVLSDLYKDEPTTWWQRSKLLTLLSILNAKLGAGDVNGARRAYEESRTIAIQLDLQRGWAKQIRDNFEKLRQKGIVHPYMDEVEGVLKPPSFKRRR